MGQTAEGDNVVAVRLQVLPNADMEACRACSVNPGSAKEPWTALRTHRIAFPAVPQWYQNLSAFGPIYIPTQHYQVLGPQNSPVCKVR